ncbi:MAG: sensor histidine kinase [Hyphomicrobiaceae bacterium]
MDFDDSITGPAPLVAAGQLMAQRKAFGLVWIDKDLVVRARYGPLVSFIAVDTPIVETLFPLVGMEHELANLMRDSSRVLYLPEIAPITDDTSDTRLNLTFFWSVEEKRYLMLVARSLSETGLEQELSKQMRARLIAEAKVTEKSRALGKANKELARANQDLEDYAAIISHDLKAPLRGMRYIADDIASSIELGDTQASLNHLRKLQDQSQRMSQLMSALLDYASVGHKVDIIEPVDTNALVRETVQSLSHLAGMNIEIMGTWPLIDTLRAPLDLVIRNLVDNAIKHHDQQTGHIVVTGELEQSNLVISVEDDGPGIDPKNHTAVFLPFRTLATKGADGRGMGLALIKRTIDTVGGTLELFSNPTLQRGTRFKVCWPINSK